MQHAAPDPSPLAPFAASASPEELVRAIRGDAVDDAFRASLEVGPSLYRHLVRARIVSATMVLLQRTEKIGFHTDSVGEEGAIVGAALALGEADWLFPGGREWYAALARGLALAIYVHHAFGSAEDPATGHASPDHLPSRALRVVPPSGIQSAHLPQAVGAAWAAKIKREDVAAVALFGSEVASSGDFHNALNFAGVFKAPVVLVCRARPGERVADRAVAYGLASARVDGSDPFAVHAVVRAALGRARAAEKKGPTLIEVVVPVLPAIARLDDAALASDAVLELGDGDPLVRVGAVLAKGERTPHVPDARGRIVDEVRAELDAAVAAAARVGAPARATIFDHVYAGVPAHLAAERRKLIGG